MHFVPGSIEMHRPFFRRVPFCDPSKFRDALWLMFDDRVAESVVRYPQDGTLLRHDRHGTHVVRVDARGTTKECDECGVETRKPLWVREHSCPACGHTEDRDLNAAKNILDRGLNKLSLHVGPGRSESTSVETVLPAFARHSGRVDATYVVDAGSPAA